MKGGVLLNSHRVRTLLTRSYRSVVTLYLQKHTLSSFSVGAPSRGDWRCQVTGCITGGVGRFVLFVFKFLPPLFFLPPLLFVVGLTIMGTDLQYAVLLSPPPVSQSNKRGM